ncbi:RICIN domain-containing protein [Actinomadura coerulea]|uniref:RICIN domain-containing protein n=1 Tax=Actinomadura coerulea TaxID=46159 RepID=UPI00343DF4F5
MFRLTSRTTALAASALAAGTLAITPAAYADTTHTQQRIINRMDGSRLALLNDSTADGAEVISLRAPGWHYRTSRWTQIITGSNRVLKNEASGKCIQPATATPKEGDRLVVRTCDGSAAQNWGRPFDEVGNTSTGWGQFQLASNPTLAIGIDTYQGSGSWDNLYLIRSQTSADRLWRSEKDTTTP